jgi:anthranilate phosphoribosyltransferase
MALHAHLKRIVERQETLSRADARVLLEDVLAGSADTADPRATHDLQIAALLGAIAARGETAPELAGFVDAMRAAATPIPLDEAERTLLVDTCGTGADASGTFNISTAAALVAAAAGATVAKHGNRAVTSTCGSADVLEALGIPVTLTPEAAAAALRTHRFAFLHAPTLHPATKAVQPVRRALGVRTVFNVLGPLTNPAGARAQVMGVYAAHLVPIVAEAMRLLGVRHAFVVHGSASPEVNPATPSATISAPAVGLDELSISGPTDIAEVRAGAIAFTRITPAELGLTRAPMESLRGGDAATNAAILMAIFSGGPGPHRDVVLLNAAAVLITANLVPDPAHASASDTIQRLRVGIAQAARTIDSGAVTTLVANLAAHKRKA